MDRAFLDANVLFSAAYGSPRLGLLWDLVRTRRCALLASSHVVEEARRNLDRPEHRAALERLLGQVTIVAEPPPDLPCPIDLPEPDRIAFLAAMASGATHFLTGDVRHFGAHYGKSFGRVTILAPGAYLAATKRRRATGTSYTTKRPGKHPSG